MLGLVWLALGPVAAGDEIHSPVLLEGWPETVRVAAGTAVGECLVTDLDPTDADPHPTIVVVTSTRTDFGSEAVIYLYGPRGDQESHQELRVPLRFGASDVSVSAGDLDGDGDQELVLVAVVREPFTSTDVLALEAEEGTGPIWFVDDLQAVSVTPPVVADLDGDGTSEVLVVGDRRLYVFGAGGTLMRHWGWPRDVEFGEHGVAVADLDGEGGLEVIATVLRTDRQSGDRLWAVHAWHHSAEGLSNEGLVEGFPVFLPPPPEGTSRQVSQPPQVAPLFGQAAGLAILQTAVDFQDPISGTARGRVFVIARGEAGWAVQDAVATDDIPLPVIHHHSPLAVSDVLGDARPELIAAFGGQLVGWTFDAAQSRFVPLPGEWPVTLFGEPSPRRATSPVVADVNGDGRPDILYMTSGPIGDPPSVFVLPIVHAVKANGRRAIRPWDPFVPWVFGNVPVPDLPSQLTVADVDGDGGTDVILAFVYEQGEDEDLRRVLQTIVMNTSGHFDGAPWPMSQGNPARTGQYDPAQEPPVYFLRGDANRDGEVNLTDALVVLNFLFRSGPPPACPDGADADDHGTLELTDPVRILNHLFLGGQPPATPFPDPGPDPTPDALGCNR